MSGAPKPKKEKKAPTPERVARLFAVKLSPFSKNDRKAILKSASAMLRLAAKLSG